MTMELIENDEPCLHDYGLSRLCLAESSEASLRGDNQDENPASIRMRMRRFGGEEGRA